MNFIKHLNSVFHFFEKDPRLPSKNPHTGSVVQMINFCTCTTPKIGLDSPKIDGHVGHYNPIDVLVTIYKHENMITHGRLFNEQVVLKYFASINKTRERGIKFLFYYQLKNRKVSGGAEVRDWKALAQSWILKSDNRGAHRMGVNIKQKFYLLLFPAMIKKMSHSGLVRNVVWPEKIIQWLDYRSVGNGNEVASEHPVIWEYLDF